MDPNNGNFPRILTLGDEEDWKPGSGQRRTLFPVTGIPQFSSLVRMLCRMRLKPDNDESMAGPHFDQLRGSHCWSST